jgi:uncharacterized protein DUF6933
MPIVMFTKRLWLMAGGRGELPLRDFDASDPGRLRAWAANWIETPVGDFVVGLEETTYLTVVCPLLRLPDFYRAFAASFATQLEVLGVAHEVVEAEVRAFIDHPRPAKNDNRRLLGSLNDVAFNAFVRFEHKHRVDLSFIQRVQEELNEMPHVKREPAFPSEATKLFFATAGSA